MSYNNNIEWEYIRDVKKSISLKREQRINDEGGENSVSLQNLHPHIIRKTIKDKLEGWVAGELLGVQGQVKHLIREAKSPDNLSLLFEGWGAWY